MDIILPNVRLQDEQKFLDCAAKFNYDAFQAQMFVFCTNQSDVDAYPLMGDDRLQQLIYAWDTCDVHNRECITEELEHMLKVLAHHTLQLWFGEEWKYSVGSLKRMLLFFLNKGCSALMQVKGLCGIDWHYLLNLQAAPWRLPYLQQLFINLRRNKKQEIEHDVPAATAEDVTYYQQEPLYLIILRLIKLFDAGNWEAVKQLSLRVLSAWLQLHATSSAQCLQQDKNITLVAHLYLMTVFGADDNAGFKIDNLMYNIRFYMRGLQEQPCVELLSYTPALLIAHICVLLGLGKHSFFEQIVFKQFSLNLVHPFAVALEAYASYVLGNQLLELMALNEHDFMAQFEQFKQLMQHYVNQRELSEQFLFNELQKQEAQRNSHCLPHVVKLNLNFQHLICKGNRASNIGNYKNCDDDEKPMLVPEADDELDRQIDPIFQNVPYNAQVLDFVYKLLSQRSHRGWQFAKIALLLKIIGQKLNTIEVWRYHPGLTTQFMLNLELKLADSYADLAKVFHEHAFMEAEFWLTAFYLHPTRANYIEVKRCSRIKTKRLEEDEPMPSRPSRCFKIENAKYELLSSTIDVDEIVAVTNHYDAVTDYDAVLRILQALRLPRSIVKDLLTVAFLPRNKRYSWALDWSTLQERCEALLKSPELKRKFVALNMAEASDGLKFLKIDYAKYKNRPQLDYGSIEQGYEAAANMPEEHEEQPAPELDAEAAREKAALERKRKRSKFWDEVSEDDEEEEQQQTDEEEDYYTGAGRRTRVRAAAVVANAMISDMERAMRSGRVQTSAEQAEELQVEDAPPLPAAEPEQPKRRFGELLQACAKVNNTTSGFSAITDIWNCDKQELQHIEADDCMFMESRGLMAKFMQLQEKKEQQQLDQPLDESSEASSSTSMTALHGEDSASDSASGVSKALRPTTVLTIATEGLQQPVTTTTSEVETITATEGESEEERRVQTITTIDAAKLAAECLTRQLEIRLKKLTSQDIEQLRGLRVLIKRTNFESYYKAKAEEATTPPTEEARTRLVALGRPRMKQLQRLKPNQSDSSSSTETEDKVKACPASQRRKRVLKAQQASKSIKQLKRKRPRHITADVIELSSDSLSSSLSPLPLNMPVTVTVHSHYAHLDDPLYEEEIVPF
ncbi:uncharacterized protein LOC108601130 isoform X1 [Drosophila busckii]|uniref:uncharacterized protein LOC108601130 isoform X1 n=1 Tax=Drosophila busckii TaxID=30019 RepID=UPI00083ECA5C|nr:uncharacterized protein LOC108601130 isoform X1 [Drosophila busckii]